MVKTGLDFFLRFLGVLVCVGLAMILSARFWPAPIEPSAAIATSRADKQNLTQAVIRRRPYAPDAASQSASLPPLPAPAGIAPSRLRAAFVRGAAILNSSAADDQKTAGARLVYAAAVFGYKPARALIAREYPSSPIIRSAVPAPDAVRFSLDALIAPTNVSSDRFMVLLIAYFSGKAELIAYSRYMLDAMGEDRRLQSDDAINRLQERLAHVSGSCLVVAHTLVHVRIVSGAACSRTLKLQITAYLAHPQPSGRDAESRASALRILKSESNFQCGCCPAVADRNFREPLKEMGSDQVGCFSSPATRRRTE